MTTIDNKSGNLVTAEEAREGINSLIKQYREILDGINISIKEHEQAIIALKEQKERLKAFIPNNAPIK